MGTRRTGAEGGHALSVSLNPFSLAAINRGWGKEQQLQGCPILPALWVVVTDVTVPSEIVKAVANPGVFWDVMTVCETVIKNLAVRS